MTVQNTKKEPMNKFLLASVVMAGSMTALLGGCKSHSTSTPAPQQQAAATPADTAAALPDAAPQQPMTPADEAAQIQANAENQDRVPPREYLAPGPVRLGKDGKPLPVVPASPSERHQQDLQMKADIEALNAGQAPMNDEQRGLAKLNEHDRGLLLKRINQALAAYHG